MHPILQTVIRTCHPITGIQAPRRLPHIMLSIDTGPDTTGKEPTDERLTSPAFRQELERLAPELVEKFDIISRSRSEDLEKYGQLYLKTKSDLIKVQEATSLQDDNDGRDVHAVHNPFDENENISPVTKTDSINSSAAFGLREEVVRTRMNLFGCAPSSVARSGASNSSVVFERPQAKAAKEMIVLSDSTRSPMTTTAQSNSSVGSGRPQVEKSKRRIALTDSTKSNDDQGSAQSTRAVHAVTTSDALLAIRMNIKLVPAVQILMTSDLTPSDRLRAREHAQAALQYANECDASVALAARCCFYIAHSYYDRDDKTTLPVAVAWFERATEASGGDHPEGQWAQQWLNHYASVKIDADSRPSTAGSWFSSGNKVLNGVWNMITKTNSNESSSAPVSPSAPKPRPKPLWRMYSIGSNPTADQKQGLEERQPSSLPTKNASISPISDTSSTTQDLHGLKWSANAPYGKGEIINGQQFELVQSPEPINPIAEEDEEEEKQISTNVLGGLVDAAALKPAYPLSRYRPRRPWSESDFEVPDYMLEKKYHVVNASSPSESPGASTSLSDSKK